MATSRQFPISLLSRALLASAAIATLVGAAPALAQQAVLGTIIIQADRSPMQREQIGRSLTVIDAKQLEISKAPYIVDVLRQVPGLAVSTSGSAGSLSQVRIRGGEGNHTLVLIDGVVANSASDGEFDFGRLQVGEVERIEVLRGPQGAFWGSNAISGVINIVTKQGIRSGLRTTLGTEFGSDGTKMGSALLQYGQDNFSWSGSVMARGTDGFNISSIGDEKDGSQHFDANFKFRADISPSVTLDGNLRYGNSLADGDSNPLVGDSANSTRTAELIGSLGGRWTNEDASWFQTARFSANHVDQLYRDGVGGGSDTATKRYKGSYQLGHRFYTPEFYNAEHTLTGGYDLTHEKYKSSEDTDAFDRTMHSFTGEYRGKFDNQFYLTAALRHDFNDRFEDFTSYSVSAAWQVPGTATRLHASAGTGSSNPGFYEQFYGGATPWGSLTPNPNLLPEQSFAWDVGIEQALLDGRLSVDATYFEQRLENLIQVTDDNPATVLNLPGISTRQGIELTGTLDFFNGFVASASYTYTHARTSDGEVEIRRPTNVGVVNLSYSFDEIPLTVHASANFVGASRDSVWGVGGVDLPGFTELGAGLNYKVSDSVEVYGRVTNILNTPNQTVYGYNTPGRAFYVGAKASF